MEFGDIIREIKRKKELEGVSNNFVRKRIVDYLDKYEKPTKKDIKRKTSKYKKLFKTIRGELHVVYGMFQKREKRSKVVYKKIFSLFDGDKILDLGCGLAPMEYSLLFPRKNYLVCDIGKNDIDMLNMFFKKNNIKGNAGVCDLLSVKKLPKADVCFLFNVMESLEYLERDVSGRLLKMIKAKHIIVSFSKKVLGGKEMIKKKGRSWFRRLLKEISYPYTIHDIGDEIFFVIEKS